MPINGKTKTPFWQSPIVSLLLLLALCGLVFLGKISSNDTFLHIGIGNDLLKNGFHDADPFSFSQKNTPYIAHEWLCQVLLSVLYQLGGIWGLFLFKILCCVGFIYVLHTLIPDKSRFIYYVPLLVAVPLAYAHAQIRPHILAWLLSAVLMRLLITKKHNYLPVLMFLWANIHASFVLGLVVLSVLMWEQYQADRSKKTLIIWALCCLSPLVNPFFYKIYFFIFEINDYVHKVDEWLPFEPKTIYFKAWLLFCFMTILSFFIGSKTSVLRVLLSGALIYLGFSAMRHSIVALIYLSPLVFQNINGSTSSFLRPNNKWLTLLILVLIPFVWIYKNKAHEWGIGINEQALCVKASGFIKKHDLQGNMFNDYNFGGYLLWDGYPHKKVFVDGRLEVYAGQVLDDYYTISKASPEWEELLNAYHIDFLVIRPERELSRVLTKHSNWELVYFDYNAIIVFRKNTNPHVKRLIAVTPFGSRNQAPVSAVIEEISYLVHENPLFFGGYKILAFQYAKLNQLDLSKEYINKYLLLHPQGIENQETRRFMRQIGLPVPKNGR